MIEQNDMHKTQQRIRKTLLFAFNMGHEEFEQLLPRILATNCTQHYLDDHWYMMRANPAKWLLNLDFEAQERFIQAALDKYGD